MEDEELILNADEDELVTLSKDLENISFENTTDLSEYFEILSKTDTKKSES